MYVCDHCTMHSARLFHTCTTAFGDQEVTDHSVCNNSDCKQANKQTRPNHSHRHSHTAAGHLTAAAAAAATHAAVITAPAPEGRGLCP